MWKYSWMLLLLLGGGCFAQDVEVLWGESPCVGALNFAPNTDLLEAAYLRHEEQTDSTGSFTSVRTTIIHTKQGDVLRIVTNVEDLYAKAYLNDKALMLQTIGAKRTVFDLTLDYNAEAITCFDGKIYILSGGLHQANGRFAISTYYLVIDIPSKTFVVTHSQNWQISKDFGDVNGDGLLDLFTAQDNGYEDRENGAWFFSVKGWTFKPSGVERLLNRDGAPFEMIYACDDGSVCINCRVVKSDALK